MDFNYQTTLIKNMEKRTEGAWIIHHTKKLLEINGTNDFEDVELAGKCGIFLSNLAASNEQSEINSEKVDAIAKVSNIKKTEIETIKSKLASSNLIDIGSNGAISVLGITSTSVLIHTDDIFNSTSPNPFQKATLALADDISSLPKGELILKEYISDTFRLASDSTSDLFSQCEEIGLVDFEKLDDGSKFYFNGNLFRNGSVEKKTSVVISSLKDADTRKILELDGLLATTGCLPIQKAISILGEPLFDKLKSIGMYDINTVSNTKEATSFITRPSSFSKFGNPFEEDALDLAKAFVTSLYYGMNYSPSSRGKITMLGILMRRLVAGYEVGPATAIGEDYKLLELRRVIQTRKDPTNPQRYYMKLLKRDVGELALQVLEVGDASEQAIKELVSGSVNFYSGPERNRVIARKTQKTETKKDVANLLRTFRQ